ncbi:MAG: enterotoxin [Verrucomicrobiae bacterium]|nr:enterotoxin [Verrucomicrobiae bacterium]
MKTHMFVPSCLLAAATVVTGVDFPGPKIGPTSTKKSGDTFIIGNNVISASFTLQDGCLRLRDIRDALNDKTLHCGNGNMFFVSLADGRVLESSAARLTTLPKFEPLVRNPKSARLAGRLPGRRLTATFADANGNLHIQWGAVMTDGANYLRMEVDVMPTAADCVIREITWMDLTVPGARVAGRTDGSPVVADHFFFGCEDPHALAADGRVAFRLPRDTPLRKGETLTVSFVAGVASPGQMRRAFLCYLERERAHPYRPYLHYNSWYDISWRGALFNEATSLEAIRLFGERFIRPHGVIMDGMVFDDGWDDPKTLWQFNSGFPNGFAPLAALCKRYRTRLGVWLSPFGGYGELKKQRLQFGREQGYEINATGFSLAGPKYYAAFKAACVGMIRNYGVNHFKFDGIAAGSYASGGAAYVLDTEAMRRLMLELRREDPNLYINLTTGSWPSPFWLRYADSIWRQGHDMSFAGKGPKQQQWLTYRDQEVFRSIVGKGPLFPLSSLMTQGVAYSRHGDAGEKTFNSAGFKDDVRTFFGGGTSLQELYIQPGKLTEEDWAVLAEAAKWSRANSDVLADTHWIGGDPAKLEVYGYASWSPRKGVVMLRNPDDQPREFRLDVGAAFELPPGAPRAYVLRSPWKSEASRPALTLTAGQPHTIKLQPFEVLVFDAFPKR